MQGVHSAVPLGSAFLETGRQAEGEGSPSDHLAASATPPAAPKLAWPFKVATGGQKAGLFYVQLDQSVARAAPVPGEAPL